MVGSRKTSRTSWSPGGGTKMYPVLHIKVNIWDIRTESVVSSIFGAKIAGDSLDIRDNMVLTGANRGKDQLQLWDWR